MTRMLRRVACVLALFAMHSALVRTQAPPSEPGTVRSSNALEQAWSLDNARVSGVVGDTKTGLIYTATEPAQILEIDLAGTIQRRISLRAPTIPATGTLRLARSAGGNRPTLLAFGVWTPDVWAFDLNGNQLWAYPGTRPRSTGIDDVNVVDLDGDGTDEVIIGFGGGTGVRVIDRGGQLLWQSTSIGNVWNVSGGDVLGKGKPQVITTSAGGSVHVFSHDGSERKDIRPTFYAHMVRAGKIPGTAEVATIFAAGTGRDITTIAALSLDGSTRWSLRLESRIHAAWLAPLKPWLAVSSNVGAVVHVIDVERGAVIGSVDAHGPIVEVGWSGNEENGSPLLLVSGGGILTAYRVTTTR